MQLAQRILRKELKARKIYNIVRPIECRIAKELE